MKKIFIDKAISFITKYKNYSNDDIDKLRYGLEGIYLTLSKTIILIIFALILGLLKELILLILLFNIIRFTGFGFHAEKSYQCLIISTIEFILIPYIVLQIYIPKYILYITSSICILIYLLYAPADTIKRPLLNVKKRKIRKLTTVVIGFIYLLGIILIKHEGVYKIITLALILEAISIIPLTYKIFKQPYRNYLLVNDV